jgi:uncharacterized protein (TIGR03000 family)
MVLMMAMSTSPEAIACGKSCMGCTGYSCQGYVVTSCHGCSGGLFKSSCHGCTGYTSCHGCTGYTSCHGCTGYTSCCGGGMFGLFKRGHGCTGYSCTGCTGYSCSGCYGTPVPVGPKEMPIPAPKKEEPKKTSATITVSVPVDAKISIDGNPTKSTSAVRVFATPELTPGTVYYYTISAEVVRDGKTVTASEQIAVEAGLNASLSLNPAAAPTVASK